MKNREYEQVPLNVLPLVRKGQAEIEAEKEAQRQEDERWKQIRETQERALREIFPEELRRFVHLRGAINPYSKMANLDLIIPGLAPIQAMISPGLAPIQAMINQNELLWEINHVLYILPDFIEDGQDVFWVWDTDDCVVEKDLARALATAHELYELREQRRDDLVSGAPELEYVDLDQEPTA